MKIVWLPRSQRDLKRSHDYIAQKSPSAARIVIERILTQVELLGAFPVSGRVGRVTGTRELVISRTPYILAYRATNDRVEVLAVIHGKRRWPKGF